MTKDELKEYFKQGKIPTENNFSDLINFSIYSHKEIIINNTDAWINFINNYIVNNREYYVNGLINGDIINGYLFIINGHSNIDFYIDRTINFVNCTFLIGSLEDKILNFTNCNFYNCVIDNKYAIITSGNYYYCNITSYSNIESTPNILNSKLRFSKDTCTLTVSNLMGSYIVGGIITASRIYSSIIDSSYITGSINDSKCIIKNAQIDGLKFGSSATWVELINCNLSSESLFENSDVDNIAGNIYGCNFRFATKTSVTLKGVHSCKLNSTIINQFFADTFGEKSASEYGDNIVI